MGGLPTYPPNLGLVGLVKLVCSSVYTPIPLILVLTSLYFTGFTGVDDPYEPPLTSEVRSSLFCLFNIFNTRGLIVLLDSGISLFQIISMF